jgi:nondiscriminating glutamyl-tRNA synthetase
MHIRTRIAPSPTGYMHIGTLRTIMWDYFMARQAGGEFIIRIEDTDQERYVPGLEALLSALQRVGIDWDEGPVLNADGSLGEKGAHGPYTQTKRLEIYAEYAKKLVDAGHAYHCFCSPERLEEMRAEQMQLKQNPKYDRKCLSLASDEIIARHASGERSVIRMKIPEGAVTFDDAIRGKISFDLKDVDDQVIVKSNGILHTISVVVDDYLMKISHVLRGEEWLSTLKQIVLHAMLGIPCLHMRTFRFILNPDKTKPKPVISVEGFLAKGFLPEAIKNFISTLGLTLRRSRNLYA